VKLLHTADWHLGADLYRIDRTNDQLARIAELLDICDREEVEVLLVAGDVFDEYRPETLNGIIRRLSQLLRPRLDRGMSAVFLCGNHDREQIFPFLRTIQAFVGGNANTSHVVFAERPELRIVRGRSEQVRLMLLPYPRQSAYGMEAVQFTSTAERHDQVSKAVKAQMHDFEDEIKATKDGIPTVVVGHLLLTGMPARATLELTEDQDVPIDRQALPTYAYTALGHIHKPQEVGTPTVRYSGSIERMTFDEGSEEKSVVVVDVATSGLRDLQVVPLNPTPLIKLHVTAGESMKERLRDVPEVDRAIVRLTVKLGLGQSLHAVEQEARRYIPRLCWPPEIEKEDVDRTERVAQKLDRHSVQKTVREYLGGVLANDPQRDEILAAAETLMREQGVTAG
jgi:DNA repair protein SbcD/Mre11